MTKELFESDLIDKFKIVFDMYPELNVLPIFSWGRDNGNVVSWGGTKCGGTNTCGMLYQCRFYNSFISYKDVLCNYDKLIFDWDLIETISNSHDIKSIWKMFDAPIRTEAVDVYNIIEGINCLVIVKDNVGELKIICVEL